MDAVALMHHNHWVI